MKSRIGNLGVFLLVLVGCFLVGLLSSGIAWADMPPPNCDMWITCEYEPACPQEQALYSWTYDWVKQNCINLHSTFIACGCYQ
jgi:hypothetical protein